MRKVRVACQRGDLLKVRIACMADIPYTGAVVGDAVDDHEPVAGFAKHAEGFGVKRVKVEYEDRKRIAQERQMSLAEVAETLEKEL